MTAPGPRDLQAEEEAREFAGWAEAQGYGDDEELFNFAEMADAFANGMQAQRDLDAAREPGPEQLAAYADDREADEITRAAAVDVNDLPVTAAAAALYRLASRWWAEAFRLGRILDQKHPRAVALEDCSTALRAVVNGLRRDGAL